MQSGQLSIPLSRVICPKVLEPLSQESSRPFLTAPLSNDHQLTQLEPSLGSKNGSTQACAGQSSSIPNLFPSRQLERESILWIAFLDRFYSPSITPDRSLSR